MAKARRSTYFRYFIPESDQSHDNTSIHTYRCVVMWLVRTLVRIHVSVQSHRFVVEAVALSRYGSFYCHPLKFSEFYGWTSISPAWSARAPNVTKSWLETENGVFWGFDVISHPTNHFIYPCLNELEVWMESENSKEHTAVCKSSSQWNSFSVVIGVKSVGHPVLTSYSMVIGDGFLMS